ncbi:MAG: tRNA pseudouridine(13) synthase TruD [Haloferacaceae archaeon]
MREAHPTERAVGIAWYASDAPGTGGRLRDRPEDFRVEEIETLDPDPLDADPGSYPCLLVRATLREWETTHFARRLADALGASRERVSWAGTKDRNAATTQLFTVRKAQPEDLPALAGAEIEPVGRLGRDLTFGDLAGNRFEIRVREPGHPENAERVTADLRGDDEGSGANADDPPTVGVPNYFGSQRFGSGRQVTHEVGLCLLRDDPRGAVLSYCGAPADAEPDDTRAARAFVDEQAGSADPRWGEAAERMPAPMGHERAMLSRLAERGVVESSPDEDWLWALSAVPSALQRLFVNAAQSLIFNRIVSARLERGVPLAEPVAGDVVAFADRSGPPGAPPRPDPDRLQRVDEGRVEVATRHCRRGRAFVTAPLVGTETEFGDGDPGAIEREVCADLGVEPADFALPEGFDSRGTRRAVLVQTEVTVDRGDESEDGDYTLEFSLPSGSYATVLLREYLKVDPARL